MREETRVPETLAAIVDLEALRSVFDDADVRYVMLFGSYGSGTESATSDIDIGIRFADTCSRRDRFRQRNQIDAVVQSYADPVVDVSDIEALPDAVALNALRNGRILYGDQAVRAADERHLNRRFDSEREQRDRERREFIDRLAEGNV